VIVICYCKINILSRLSSIVDLLV